MTRLATVTPLLLGLWGCTTWTVRSEAHPVAPLAAYRTYEWAMPDGSPQSDRLVDQRVRERVAVELAKKGMRPVPPGQTPDCYIEYSVGTGPRVQQARFDFSMPVGIIGASGATIVPPAPGLQPFVYTEQALVLDFVDARSGRVFWRGYASYVVERPPEVGTGKTGEAVGRILRRFPGPQVAGTARPAG
jgi:hypothetical protein